MLACHLQQKKCVLVFGFINMGNPLDAEWICLDDKGIFLVVLQQPHTVTKFTVEFDFMAMNEKFKKDEVWGHLGKSKAQLRDKDQELKDDEADYSLQDNESEGVKLDTKPVYVKDDFFDTLSCTTLDRGTRNGRARFSEQLKLDTETFGDFPRHRPIWSGGRGFRGGSRGRGSHNGRGGYGYTGRGRGYSFPSRAS